MCMCLFIKTQLSHTGHCARCQIPSNYTPGYVDVFVPLYYVNTHKNTVHVCANHPHPPPHHTTPTPTRNPIQAGPYDPPQASKYFLNPNVATSITPHTADLLPGALPMVMVEPSCAYISHLVNLIHPRHTKEGDYFDKPNTWWWLKADTNLWYTL